MQHPRSDDTSGVVVGGALLAFVLAVGALGQFVTAAHGIYLTTAGFSPSDLAEVPGQSLDGIRTRGYISLFIASLPVLAGAAACLFSRVSGSSWRPSLRRAAVVAAGADVLVLVFAVLTSM